VLVGVTKKSSKSENSIKEGSKGQVVRVIPDSRGLLSCWDRVLSFSIGDVRTV